MKKQKSVLVIGGGAREHAIGWKLRQSPHVGKIFFAPGNAGTASLPYSENLPINVGETNKLVNFASKNKIGLTIVGPEGPLMDGIEGTFRAEGLVIFAPTLEAAMVEGDKGFAAEFMKANHIPQPDFELHDNLKSALEFVQTPKWEKFVVKATGLANGKGVMLPNSRDEATDAVKRIFVKREFGDNQSVLFQERLYGTEVSLISFTDGKTIIPLLPARDYKRVRDNDKGPNTGGMGAIVDRELLSADQLHEAIEKILKPTIEGLRHQGSLFSGALYVGLMITDEGLKVLEYNARFGDPETQPQMLMLESDLFELLEACADGNLDDKEIKFSDGSAVGVVLASEGYPGEPKTGDVINGLDSVSDDVVVFQAATKQEDSGTVTDGGRVLTVNAKGSDIDEARRKAYSVVGPRGINFSGMHYRKDIGS